MPRFGLVALLSPLGLAACGGPPSQDLGIAAPLECVPFARVLTGIDLHGDARDWWWRASGRYRRGRTPEVGAVMVFTPTARLPHGHVAVVSRIMSPRDLLVTQANWVHHHVTTDQLVRDESSSNNWSLVRVWWPPSGQLGSTLYPVTGFIYEDHLTTHARITRAVPRAVRVALTE
jgi:CHAP domain